LPAGAVALAQGANRHAPASAPKMYFMVLP
jgi:hypothetical protein